MTPQLTAHYLANRYPHKVVITYSCPHDAVKVKHHPDYDKPYDVELLCHKCHGERRRGFLNGKRIGGRTEEDKKQMILYIKEWCEERGDLKVRARHFGMPYDSLWRIVRGKTKGSTSNWDKIFQYYGR